MEGFQDIKFEVAIKPKDLEIYADEKQIIQVLLNLVKNAIQSINKTGNQGLILLKTKKDEYSNIVLSVTDNGLGVPLEIQDQIFIPFFTTKEEGTGIGLSLSKHIMKLHGGSLQVTSKPNESTTFSLKL